MFECHLIPMKIGNISMNIIFPCPPHLYPLVNTNIGIYLEYWTVMTKTKGYDKYNFGNYVHNTFN